MIVSSFYCRVKLFHYVVCPECVLSLDRDHVQAIRVQKYKMFGNQQRKLRKNLEGTGKMLTFAASNLKFGYAAECGE